MTTIALQKEIRVLKQRQTRLERQVRGILARREQGLPYGDWELKPSAVKRIERARKQIIAGRGMTLQSAEEIRKYFHNRRHAR